MFKIAMFVDFPWQKMLDMFKHVPSPLETTSQEIVQIHVKHCEKMRRSNFWFGLFAGKCPTI